jgi:hypothetical protein
MSIVFRTLLIFSLLILTEVVRGEQSFLVINLLSLRVGPFLVEVALVVGRIGFPTDTRFANGGEVIFLNFFAICTLVVRAGSVFMVVGGGGGGHGGKD